MPDPSADPASPDSRHGSADGDGAPTEAAPVAEPRYSRFPLPDPAEPQATGRTGAATDPLQLIAPHVDAAFYSAGLPGDAAAARDPVAHFHESGWRQGRAPSPDFDTRYYLRTNQDVLAAGIDPLLHYVRFGRHEGRLPQRPGGARRALAEGAQPPAQRRPGHHAPPDAATLDGQALLAALRKACLGRRGLVVSLSHDRYIDTTGGMQIFIADEQAQFNADRIAYLHIAPVITRLTLAAEDSVDLPLQLTLDGAVLGVAPGEDVIAGLGALDAAAVQYRLFIVHSLFGHRCSDVVRMAAACRPVRNFFWLHDYGTLCAGYNLLRNDATFCGAPDETSMGCRICVYGEGRAGYRAAIAGLFGQVAFDVMAPSEGTMALWRDRVGPIAWRSVRVHPNALLRPTARREARPGPVRIAFIGYPNPAKGWALFLDIFRRARGRSDLAFYHFANPEALRPMPGITGVPVRVDRHDRLAMARAIAAEDIDLVAMLAPWPETFSYVTREAFAGGGDVVALASGGAVADAVREEGRGLVFGTEAAVLRFFLDGQVEAYVALQRAAGREAGDMLACGTTATFDPLSAVLGPARLETRDPALRVVAGDALIAGRDEAGTLVFDLPEGRAEVRLVSRHVVPARLDPSGGDPRRLGVAITSLALDDAAVPIGDARRRAGWHGAVPADGLQWTNGDATLDVGGARRLSIGLADVLVYQRCKLIPES